MSLRKHTVYNLLGAVLPIGLSLVTIPIYISLIGEARYGVLAIAWLLLGYFGLFDLGLGRATAQRIASINDSSPDELSETFWTALIMNISLGIVGGLIIWPVATFYFRFFFSVNTALELELTTAIPWLVLAVPMATLSGVLSGALEGRFKFFELNLISIFSSILIQVLPLVVAIFYSPDLTLLIPAVIFARLITLILFFSRCYKHIFKGLPPNPSIFLAKNLLQFGGWVTVTSIVGPMMLILDRFIIGTALGAKAVTYYTVPFQLTERSTILSSALASALFPRLASTDPYQSRKLITKAIESLAILMTPITLIGLLMIDSFIQWWLGPEFAVEMGSVGKVLLIGFWINSIARIPYVQLQATGLPNIVAKCHLGELFPYLILLNVGLHFWGLLGAAIVFGLRTLADCILLFWFTNNLVVLFDTLCIPALLILAGLFVSVYLPIGSIFWWIGAMVLVLIFLRWAAHNLSLEVRNFAMRMLKN